MIGRVGDRTTFDALRRTPHRARRGAMSVAYVPCGDEVRVAYAIGRQVGPAVVRNRLRRRLRAAVREVDVEIGGLHPGAYLVSPSRGAVGHHYDELRADLRRAAEAAAGGPASPAVGR